MPVPRKRKHARSGRGELTEDQLDYLVSGGCLDSGAPIGSVDRWDVDGEVMPFRSMAEMEAAYTKHRPAVEAKLQSQREWNKDLRSWAWWQFISPSPRLQLSGPKPIADLDAHFAAGALNYYSGRHGAFKSYEESTKAIFETDYQYLQRLDLLQSGDSEEVKEVEHVIIYNRKNTNDDD